jgi:hypothetical protein
MENDDVSVILEEHGMNQGNLEAAAELARLVANPAVSHGGPVNGYCPRCRLSFNPGLS